MPGVLNLLTSLFFLGFFSHLYTFIIASKSRFLAGCFRKRFFFLIYLLIFIRCDVNGWSLSWYARHIPWSMRYVMISNVSLNPFIRYVSRYEGFLAWKILRMCVVNKLISVPPCFALVYRFIFIKARSEDIWPCVFLW